MVDGTAVIALLMQQSLVKTCHRGSNTEVRKYCNLLVGMQLLHSVHVKECPWSLVTAGVLFTGLSFYTSTMQMKEVSLACKTGVVNKSTKFMYINFATKVNKTWKCILRARLLYYFFVILE